MDSYRYHRFLRLPVNKVNFSPAGSCDYLVMNPSYLAINSFSAQVKCQLQSGYISRPDQMRGRAGLGRQNSISPSVNGHQCCHSKLESIERDQIMRQLRAALSGQSDAQQCGMHGRPDQPLRTHTDELSKLHLDGQVFGSGAGHILKKRFSRSDPQRLVLTVSPAPGVKIPGLKLEKVKICECQTRHIAMNVVKLCVLGKHGKASGFRDIQKPSALKLT